MKNQPTELQKFLLKLGKEIKTRRRELNISQAQLAEKADISVTYISKIECGHKNISAYILSKIMNALNADCINSNNFLCTNESLYEAINEIITKLNSVQAENMLKILQLLGKMIIKNYT